MRLEVAYDSSFDPPAPVVPVTVEGTSGTLVLLPMLLDTGADCTLVPASVARRLHLPRVDTVTMAGVTGERRIVTVHAAWLRIGDARVLERVVAFEREAILGRDLLERMVTRLHGPRSKLTLSRSHRARAIGSGGG